MHSVTSIEILKSKRLLLRPFSEADADEVELLAGEKQIAENTLLIAHPYPRGGAILWIGTHDEDRQLGSGCQLAVTLKRNKQLIGAIGLDINRDNNSAELGYWIGVPYWGKGYATEAARTVLDFAFIHLNLNRVWAHHFDRNDASGRVLQKAGMRMEGYFPQHILKWGRYIDIVQYGILREDWEMQSAQSI